MKIIRSILKIPELLEAQKETNRLLNEIIKHQKRQIKNHVEPWKKSTYV